VERITITIDDGLLEILDGLCKRHGYTSRSEALRDLIRHAQTAEATKHGRQRCVATLSYVYEHGIRELAKRLTNEQHDHYDLSISTLHVHLDHKDCLEVAVLRGAVDDVRDFADMIITQRGVRHGNLTIVPPAGKTSARHRGRKPSRLRK
jgi:CopG family nickel-responsive transcriptional regulator